HSNQVYADCVDLSAVENASNRKGRTSVLETEVLTVDVPGLLRPCQPSQRTIMMAKKSLQLGRAVEWPDSPQKAQLDRVPNPQADTNYLVRFTAPEFTSICPVTGQPDFAHLMIDYVPGQWLLESKSLKLF